MNQILSYVTITVVADGPDTWREILLAIALILCAFALGMAIANAVWLNDK